MRVWVENQNNMFEGQYDYIVMTYDASNNCTKAVYKTGGASGTVVATLDMTYDASNNCLTVTKS
jgi:hypothetical protein